MTYTITFKKLTGDKTWIKCIENWEKILQTVKADYDVGDVAFNTWLKPLKV